MRRHLPKLLYVTFLTGLLYTYATILGGCGAGAIGLHAAAADAVKKVNDEAVPIVETTCQAKADAAARDPNVTTDEAEHNAQEVVDTCTTIEDSQNAFAAAHDLWVSFLLSAVADDEFDAQASLRLGIDALQFYQTIIPLAARLDFELPAIPDFVLDLLGD